MVTGGKGIAFRRDDAYGRRRRSRQLMAASCVFATSAVTALMWAAPDHVTAAPVVVPHAGSQLQQSPLPTDLPIGTPSADAPPQLPGLPDPWAEPGQTNLIERFDLGGDSYLGVDEIAPDGRTLLLDGINATIDPHHPPATLPQGLGSYLYDRITHSVELVSVDSTGKPMEVLSRASMSDDGNRIAFGSGQAWVHDRRTGKTWIVSIASNGKPGQDFSGSVSISGDGKWVAMLSGADLGGDGRPIPKSQRNAAWLVSVDHPGTVYRIGPASGPGSGARFYPSTDYDGRYVAFGAWDANSDTQIWRWDRITGATEPVSAGYTATGGRFIDASGNYIVYTNGQLIYRRNMAAGTTDQLAVDWTGMPAKLVQAWPPTISANGKFVSFSTMYPLLRDDTNLAPDPRNLPYGDIGSDVYIANTENHTLQRESVATDGTQGNDNAGDGSVVSDDGTMIVFSTAASDFAPDTPWGGLFIRTRSAAAAAGTSLPPWGTTLRGRFSVRW